MFDPQNGFNEVEKLCEVTTTTRIEKNLRRKHISKNYYFSIGLHFSAPPPKQSKTRKQIEQSRENIAERVVLLV